MPREPRSVAEAAPIPTTSLVASAVRYTAKESRNVYQPTQQWQRDCYRHYSICGEARAAARFYGHNLARSVLRMERKTPTGPEVLTEGEAVDLLDNLFNGRDGQEEMLEKIGVHFTIAGECYLVGRSVVTRGESGLEEDEEDVWEIVSVLEIEVTGGTWRIRYGDDKPPVDLSDDDVVIRMWLPDPAKRMEADSPFKSLLPILTEIEWATRHIFRQLSSRLAGAGLLFLPQEMQFPPPPAVEGQATPLNNASAFMLTLADAMLTPLEDPSDPAGTVPTVVVAPGEYIDKAKLMHFWSNLDEKVLETRNDAIHRFALGMDLPAEQVEGMSSNSGTGGGNSNGVSHWGAWQIEESTIKVHIEPMLQLVCNSLTIGYVRPLQDKPDTKERVGYDTSALRLRPDRSKEAFTLYAIGAISKETLLRENGFGKDDAMGNDEFKMWLVQKVATGSATPEMVAGALKQLGVDLPIENLQGLAPQVNEARPTPSTQDWPDEPRTPGEGSVPPPQAALLPVAEALVYRALERAGNRIRQGEGIRPPGVPSHSMHTLVRCNGRAEEYLTDAWSSAPAVLDGVVPDPEVFITTLNAYIRTLFAEQEPHSRQRLAQWLEVGSPV